MRAALDRVVHYSADIVSDEGDALAERFQAGSALPLYVLTDAEGAPITRWAGFSDPLRFVGTLKAALKDPLTVTARAERHADSPSVSDARFLAHYYAGVKDYLTSIRYYREVAGISGPRGPSVENDLFLTVVEAAWQGKLPFDSAVSAANPVLAVAQAKPNEALTAVKMLVRLARKTNRLQELEPLFMIGIDIATQIGRVRGERERLRLRADYLLHIGGDLGAATDTFCASLGPHWRDDPISQYTYAHWCVERRVHFEEATRYLTAAARYGNQRIAAASLYDIARIYEFGERFEDSRKLLEYLNQHYGYNRFYKGELKRISNLAQHTDTAK